MGALFFAMADSLSQKRITRASGRSSYYDREKAFRPVVKIDGDQFRDLRHGWEFFSECMFCPSILIIIAILVWGLIAIQKELTLIREDLREICRA